MLLALVQEALPYAEWCALRGRKPVLFDECPRCGFHGVRDFYWHEDDRSVVGAECYSCGAKAGKYQHEYIARSEGVDSEYDSAGLDGAAVKTTAQQKTIDSKIDASRREDEAAEDMDNFIHDTTVAPDVRRFFAHPLTAPAPKAAPATVWRPSWWKRVYDLLPWTIVERYLEETPEAKAGCAKAFKNWRQHKVTAPSKDKKAYAKEYRAKLASTKKVGYQAELQALAAEKARLDLEPRPSGAPKTLEALLAKGRKRAVEERERVAGKALRSIKLA